MDHVRITSSDFSRPWHDNSWSVSCYLSWCYQERHARLSALVGLCMSSCGILIRYRICIASVMVLCPTSSLDLPSKMPSLISSSGLGRCAIFSFRLSARICFSNSFWFAWIDGEAVEFGRMFPGRPANHVSPWSFTLLLLQARAKRHTFDQLFPFGPMLKSLLHVVDSSLPLEVIRRGL